MKHPIEWKSTLYPHPDDKPLRKALIYRFSTKQLNPVECLYLIERAEVGGNLVNLGCFEGTSASLLAWGLNHYEKEGHIYTVDVYETRPDLGLGTIGDSKKARNEFARQDCTDKVTQCIGTTDDWAKKLDVEISFLFIDADHSYEACKADFEAWRPKVKLGGLISFHDCHTETVTQVVEEAISDGYVEVPGCYNIRTLEKVNLV